MIVMLILMELNGASKLFETIDNAIIVIETGEGLQKCPNGCRHLIQFFSVPALKSGSFSSSLTVNSTTSKAEAEMK